MQTRTKPAGMIPFKRNINAALYYDLNIEAFVCVMGYRQDENEATYSFVEETAYKNPLEALTQFEKTFCPDIRIQYGDWLETLGYHQYSGKKKDTPAKKKGASCYNCMFGANDMATCPERGRKTGCAIGEPIDPDKEE